MIYFIYSLSFFVIGLGILSQRKKNVRQLVFLYLSIVVFWGVSYINAPDTPGYIEKFNYDIQTLSGSIDTQFEIGYTLMAMMFKTIYPHYWLFQLVVLGIEVFLIIKGLRYFFKEDVLYVIIPLLFFLYPTSLYAFRQGIATSLFIYALQYVNAESLKKSLLYLVLIGIAMLFHQSAFLLVIIYPVRFLRKVLSHNWIIFVILLLGDLSWIMGNSLLSQFDFMLPLFRGETLDMGEKYAMLLEGANKLGTFGAAKVIEINVAVIFYTLFCKNDKESGLLRANMLMYVIVGLFIGGLVAHRLNYYWSILFYVCFIRGTMEVPVFKKSPSLSYAIIALYMFWLYVIKGDFINQDYVLLFSY